MKGICIFCMEEKELTNEHFIPESIGGSLSKYILCKDCNSTIGTEIDAPLLALMPNQLARFTLKVEGKSGAIPNPFGRGGQMDNKHVMLTDELKPHLRPIVERHINDKGETSFHLEIDKSEKSDLPNLIEKIVRRNVKESDIDGDYEKYVSETVEKALLSAEEKTLDKVVQYSFQINLDDMKLGYIKIAYEFASLHFGKTYVNSSKQAENLRETIINKNTSSSIHGQVPVNNNAMDAFFPDFKKHYVLILGEMCFIQIFGLTGSIKIGDDNFIVDKDNAKIWIFDVEARTNEEKLFIDYLADQFPSEDFI